VGFCRTFLAALPRDSIAPDVIRQFCLFVAGYSGVRIRADYSVEPAALPYGYPSQGYVEQNRIPGAVGLSLQDGKPVYERAFGWADKEAGTRMSPDTIFRIASQGKAITSTAVLILVAEGKIAIDESVSDFIPARDLLSDSSRMSSRASRYSAAS